MDDNMVLLADVDAYIASKIVECIKGYFGMHNIKVVYPTGAPKPSIEVWSTGWTWQQFHKAQTFAIGVSYGIVSARGF